MALALNLKSFAPSLSLQPLLEKTALASAALLVIVLSYNFAELTWRFVPNRGNDGAPPPAQQIISSAPQRPASSTDVARLHLFGTVQSTAKAFIKPQVIRESKLNLILRGVIATGDESALAIIHNPSGSKKGDATYALGDQLPGGATLSEVHADRIILRRNGNYETLRLPRDKTNATASNTRSAIRRGRNNRDFNRSSAATTSVRQYRDTMINDPASMADMIKAAPFRKGGRQVGYRVQPGRDRTALAAFGLQAGDVVTAVNGVSLSNSANMMKVMRKLAKADTITAEVLRNGVPTTITKRMDP
ncbi:MAG: type II secretion system protein GspC [Gammaproteobacteria bacterium]|nr:type II secretion system protein GspC [Gammaproteobacteria bacterium]